jgi:hypothetical protein
MGRVDVHITDERGRMSVECVKCETVVEHDPRQIQGCGCDPDSPTWVYIETDGRVRGFSQAEWRTS